MGRGDGRYGNGVRGRGIEASRGGERGAWLAAAAAVLGLAFAHPGNAAAQEAGMRAIDETRSVAADAVVEVETVIREVRVRGWDRSEVRVQGSMLPQYEDFTFEQEGGEVRIELEPKDDVDWPRDREGPDLGALTVSVPRGASVSVEVVNGPLSVEGVSGAVELETVNGNVTYRGDARSVEAEAVNGTVDVRAPRSRETRVGSVAGNVIVRAAGGIVRAESVSGDVQVHAEGAVSEVDAETVAGDIDYRGAPAENASLAFESHSGDVTIVLPAGVNAVLEAETFSGEIESAFGGQVRRDDEYTPERSYRHTVGSGGARVTAETFSGSVSFERQGG